MATFYLHAVGGSSYWSKARPVKGACPLHP